MDPVLISYSRREADERCPRKRYWGWEYQGRGIDPTTPDPDQHFGHVVHEGLRQVLTQVTPPSEAGRQAAEQLAHPSLSPLAWGLIEGHFLSPIWLAMEHEYEILAVERMVTYNDGPYRLRAIPDLLLRRRDDGTSWYLEFKTTSYIKPAWFRQWRRAVQIMAGALAVEQTMGITLEGCLVQALYKGYKNEHGEIQSPFVYGWVLEGQPGVTTTQYRGSRPQQYRGWSRFAVAERFPTPSHWITTFRDSDPEGFAAQFPQAPPVAIDWPLARAWWEQAKAREVRIDIARGTTPIPLGEVFPQHFSQCEPAIGKPCEYLGCCWDPTIGEDPVGSGQYGWRVPRAETT